MRLKGGVGFILSRKVLPVFSVVLVFAIGVIIASITNIAKAEQSGSSPESGATSYIKQLSDDLVALDYGSVTDAPDWGAYWNRIKTAAKWLPDGTAGTTDVLLGKTFFGNSRVSQNGAYDASNLSAATVKNGTDFGVGLTGAYPSADNLLPGAGTVGTAPDLMTGKVCWANDGTQISGTYDSSNLSAATVKNGTAFGVGLTGDYPSATNPLAGTGTVAGASNVASGKVAWSNDGSKISGAAVMAGPCSTQTYYNGHASATEGNNCSSTWTTSPSPVTGDDNKAGRGGLDPKTGLVWSQYLKNNAGAIQFVASGGTSWTWDGSMKFAITAGNATAGATYTNNGQTFTVTTTCSSCTSLYATGTGSPSASGTLTKATGTGDAILTFSTTVYANNVAVGGKSASQLCNSSANPAGAGVWRLPTQNELMQAYIDGAYWNLTQPSNSYWSATLNSATAAYYAPFNDGFTNYATTYSVANSVRCVR